MIRGNETTDLNLPRHLGRMGDLIARFRQDKRGNIAIMMAAAALPLVAIVGCVVDYTMATSAKTKLQASADSATLMAVSMNSTVVATAKLMSTDGTVTGGTTYLQNIFTSNAPGTTAANITNSSVNKASNTVTATISYTAQVPTAFLGVLGIGNITVTGSSTASYTWAVYVDFYVMLDVSGSMSFPSTPAEQARLMAVNPDNLMGTNGYPGGCQFACHFTRQGACPQVSAGANASYQGPGQGPIPAAGSSTNPGTGGYCQGFIISRLGTSKNTFTANTTNGNIPPVTNFLTSATPPVHTVNPNNTNPYNGTFVNWNNTPVSSCQTDGTPSCIQLRADVIGVGLNQLFQDALQVEARTGISNQIQIGLFPFIQNLCWSSSGNSNSCSVGLTANITGSTITNFASQLANLLDTGQDPTMGSGGTHLDNALKTMNSNISSSAIGTGGGAGKGGNKPYVLIITDGSQDYQTQSGGGWSSQGWSYTPAVPFPNSATIVPPNSIDNNDYCATMKNRGITIAILYIPYAQIVNPNPNFANDEDGYANANIQNIPAALQACASPKSFYQATTPAEIKNQLWTMFNDQLNAARVTN
ncbi:MAG: pilus assembly protein [Hyphomicrobiales bacterium]|nr:pilus assembly protein [Hyphomicrobiales bacterium]MBV9429216.1 pilus assembly protein [Bradyrhizobiaceae bacterium]